MTRPAAEIRELRRRLRQGWHLLVMSFLAAFLAAAGSMLYSNRVARDSERKWCGVVATLDEAYKVTPPRTPAGQKIAQDIRQLRADFGCP